MFHLVASCGVVVLGPFSGTANRNNWQQKQYWYVYVIPNIQRAKNSKTQQSKFPKFMKKKKQQAIHIFSQLENTNQINSLEDTTWACSRQPPRTRNIYLFLWWLSEVELCNSWPILVCGEWVRIICSTRWLPSFHYCFFHPASRVWAPLRPCPSFGSSIVCVVSSSTRSVA